MLTFEKVLEIELTKEKREVTEDDERSGCPVQTASGALEGGTGMKILKCLLMIVTAPVVLVLTLFVWLCTGLIYISSLVIGLLSTVIALLGVAVIITYSPQKGVILLVMAFLISPMGLPLAAGKGAEFEICDTGLGVWVNDVNIIWNEKKQDNGR